MSKVRTRFAPSPTGRMHVGKFAYSTVCISDRKT